MVGLLLELHKGDVVAESVLEPASSNDASIRWFVTVHERRHDKMAVAVQADRRLVPPASLSFAIGPVRSPRLAQPFAVEFVMPDELPGFAIRWLWKKICTLSHVL